MYIVKRERCKPHFLTGNYFPPVKVLLLSEQLTIKKCWRRTGVVLYYNFPPPGLKPCWVTKSIKVSKCWKCFVGGNCVCMFQQQDSFPEKRKKKDTIWSMWHLRTNWIIKRGTYIAWIIFISCFPYEQWYHVGPEGLSVSLKVLSNGQCQMWRAEGRTTTSI